MSISDSKPNVELNVPGALLGAPYDDVGARGGGDERRGDVRSGFACGRGITGTLLNNKQKYNLAINLESSACKRYGVGAWVMTNVADEDDDEARECERVEGDWNGEDGCEDEEPRRISETISWCNKIVW